MLSAIEQGIITDSTKDRLSQLEAKKKEIEITILQEKIKKPFLTKEQILFGIEKYKKLDLTTQEGKQRLIDGFINAIYVYDDRITFTYNYKDGTETITLSELESAKSSDIKCVGAPLVCAVFVVCHKQARIGCAESASYSGTQCLAPIGAKLLRARPLSVLFLLCVTSRLGSVAACGKLFRPFP